MVASTNEDEVVNRAEALWTELDCPAAPPPRWNEQTVQDCYVLCKTATEAVQELSS